MKPARMFWCHNMRGENYGNKFVLCVGRRYNWICGEQQHVLPPPCALLVTKTCSHNTALSLKSANSEILIFSSRLLSSYWGEKICVVYSLAREFKISVYKEKPRTVYTTCVVSYGYQCMIDTDFSPHFSFFDRNLPCQNYM
jgi:hypothetical protein